ncbi:Outer membrane protein assembly factor BamB [Mariniflexile rhizosphaerae]|uniref:outer membrane protein assembly factor BamB family protein n=1 Tax=unclassified Mariniflexile TaxID=2643887 RepID=UPI000CC9EC05|nr:PQQ-binding-like beta-propeller repeat protein [Mariniflexile sp. TRM1-10]AXP81317.1 Outer membrane protein assembly factor BamB [Mariniflexile sp. TRM1-10]PLB18018.1 MAG: PQQ_2 domain containing protein [Flavobacteriaceae bacterium FS1-H7996/R]
MRKLNQFVLLLVGILMVNVAPAQKAETPEQTYDLGSSINEMTLTVGGILVAATNEGLVGIDPKQNTPVFTFNNFGKLKPEETDFIPASPYIVVSQGADSKFAGLTKTKRAVINYITGKTIFNSETDNWNQIYTCNIVLPQNKLIISGIQKEGDKFEKMTPKVAVYDLSTQKLDYSFFLDKPGRVGLAKDFSVTGVPLLLKEILIIPTAQGLIAKKHNGDDLWECKIKGVNWMVADKTEKEIYGFETTVNGKNTRIHKIGSNGAELWKDDRKVQGNVSNFQILPQGIAVVSDKSSGGSSSVFATSDESEIAFLSASTGEDLWQKSPKTKGYVQHFYVQDDGILFGIQQGGINKISFDGKTLFKKPLKTGANIMVMAESPQGLIYITGEDANIVDLKTGDQVWNKPLKYKNSAAVASTFDSAKNRYLIAADGDVYAIDANSGDVTEFAKVKFDEKEVANTMQMRNGNIFLSASQNVALLDSDGNQVYHEYYKSPSQSGFVKVLSGALAVASTGLAMAHAAKAGMNRTNSYGSSNDLGNYNDYGKENKRASDMFASIGDAAFDVMSKRFKATAATENAQFILTKLDAGVGLVKVNKDTGKVDKEIVLKDKKPEYQVDEVAGILYYKANDKTIYAYNLQK